MTRVLMVVCLAVGLSWLIVLPAGGTAIGDVDVAFGVAGQVTTTFPNRVSLQRVLVQPDDRIVAVGHRVDSGFDPVGHAMARYLPDGALDPSFGSGGTVQYPAPGGQTDARVASAVLQSDGRIVVAGITGAGPMLVRYTDAGVPDATFASGAGAAFADGGTEVALAQHGDGSLLLAVTEPVGALHLVRFLADGDPDPGFGVGGIGPVVPLAQFSTVEAVALLPGGGALAMVQTIAAQSTFLVRFLADGTPDASFGTGGVLTIGGSEFGDTGCQMIQGGGLSVSPDGRVFVVGTLYCPGPAVSASVVTPFVARFTAAGALDPTFGVAGVTGPSIVPDRTGHEMFIEPDGSLLVTGFTTELTGITPEGAFDPRLGPGGSTARYAPADVVTSARQADGRLVIGFGFSETTFRLIRRETSCSGPDTDGDGRNDGCDPCTGGTPADRLRVTAAKLRAPYGNDTLAITARATFPVVPAIDPTVTDARVLLEDAAGGIILDGPMYPGVAFGWQARTTPKATTYRFGSRIVSSGQASSVKVIVTTTGTVTASLKMRSAAFGSDPSRLPARFAFILTRPNASAGQCITADLTVPGACAFTGSGDALKCNR